MDNDNGTLRGLRDLLKKRGQKKVETSTGTAKGFADGGQVSPEDELAALGFTPPAPTPPPLNGVAASMKETPDTNYDFYKELGADQRKALYDQLAQQQRGPGAMISQGLAGLGDAISNSYGGKNTTFQKDVMAGQKANAADQLSAFDTQRSQRMEDQNARQAGEQNDPKSALSKSMQGILRSKGINVPSGMSAAMLTKIMGPLGDMAMKEATLGMQGMQLNETKETNAFNRDMAGKKLAADASSAASAAEQKAKQDRFDAAKGLNSRSTIAKGLDFFTGDSDATKEMKNQLGTPAEAPSALSFQDADKEARYQAWKASQGK